MPLRTERRENTSSSTLKAEEKKVRKLSDILEEKSAELVDKWAYRNRNNVWLGGPSRNMVRDEVAEAMRWAYELAKKKYHKE